MKPAASSFASVRVRFGWARPVSVTSSATDPGLRSRIKASSRRLSGVSSRTIASTESKLGLDASEGARRSPRTTAFISSRSDRRLCALTRFISTFLSPLSNHVETDAPFTKNPFHLAKAVINQRFGVLEHVRSARISLSSVPVVGRSLTPPELRTPVRSVVRVVESHEPCPIRSVEAERVRQTVRSLHRGLEARDLKLQPVPLLEVMNSTVKRNQKLKTMIGPAPTHILR